MKTKTKTTPYIVQSIAAALLLLTAENSLAGSATWLSSPQDSAWENPNNWTPGGPPNGPSDVATFAQSSQRYPNISTSVEVNSIVFTSGADSFGIGVSSNVICAGGELIISGTGIIDNSSVVQGLFSNNAGQIIFKNTATAGHTRIISGGGSDTTCSGETIFNDSSTAENAFLVANGGCYGGGGAITFNGMSTGGTARVQVSFGCTWNSGSGYLNIGSHQSGMTIGSIEGDGDVYLGANNLRVGTNNINTSFYGNISNSGRGGGSLGKVGSGVLTLGNPYGLFGLSNTLGLILVSGSTIRLDFDEVIAALKVDGVRQSPGIYGGPASGAPNILPEFAGQGTVEVAPLTLGNISTRAFVQTGDNVMIGGFIVQGTEPKKVIIRTIGPGLSRYGVPNPLDDPTLELHNSTGALIAHNDNWTTTILGGIITANQVGAIRNSGYAPGDEGEPAIIAELPAGSYTTVVRGVNSTTGVALAEVYDLRPETSSTLRNISTRSFVQSDDNVMIGGFIVTGGPKRVIVRAIGPELTQYGVPNPLMNPRLELHDGTGALIARNDNWRNTIIGGIIQFNQVGEIRDSGYAPGNGLESAIIAELPAGNYTAIVRGVNNTTGVGLVEVYDLDQ